MSGAVLARINPLAKLGVCLAWLVAALAVLDVRFLAALWAVPALALLLLHGVSPLRLLMLMIPFALFGFGFLSTHVLFARESGFAVAVARESWLQREGVSIGLALALRALSCGMISVFFALTTDAGALVRSLMRHVALPPRIAYALFVALQLVEDLAGEARRLRLARAMRRGRPPSRLPGPREMLGLVIPLLATAIRRAGRTALAMEARGFEARPARTLRHVPPFTAADALFAAGGLAALPLLLMTL